MRWERRERIERGENNEMEEKEEKREMQGEDADPPGHHPRGGARDNMQQSNLH